MEADEGVFPVADVVAKTNVQDGGPEVVRVEVEPEGIKYSVAFVDEDKDGGGGRVAAWAWEGGAQLFCGRAFVTAMG